MNCNRSRQLIPLYVGNDLDAGATNSLRMHLEKCDACAAVVDEFRESQEWLLSCDAPTVDPATMAESRQVIMAQIAGRGSGSLFHEIGAVFASRWQYSVITAVVLALAVAIAGFLVYSHRAVNGNESATNETRESRPAPPGLPRDQHPGAHPVGGVNDERPGHRQVAIKRVGHARNAATIGETRLREVEAAALTPSSSTETGETAAGLSTSGADLAPTDGVERDAFDQKMLRIEIQTENPAIRIIWFAPKPTEPIEVVREGD
jgi:hypothetical protein